MDLSNPTTRTLLSLGVMVGLFILSLVSDDDREHSRNNKLAEFTTGAWLISLVAFVIILFHSLYLLDNQ